MKTFTKWIKVIFTLAVVLVLASCYVIFYSYIHQRTVVGPVDGVHQLFENVTLLAGSRNPSPQIYSAAVAVRDTQSSEIVTGSTEDRQWGVVKEGQCVEAVFFPYPPWNLQKAGTYHNARIVKLYENCDAIKK